ncbi:hypothetical protein GCM10010977_32360 [Citricoccus zhacaiensis]|uniref:Uncharacterized protein n=1 Tax=Citricoccus zhacaiensis TaxID=489142 RepID=A0ABQ2MD67_9MICC|nr:hypothetical protein GCM10010977_32360 [Citricoccus zhacaiensis]
MDLLHTEPDLPAGREQPEYLPALIGLERVRLVPVPLRHRIRHRWPRLGTVVVRALGQPDQRQRLVL